MQKPLKKILFTLVLYSLLISVALTVWVYSFIYPYDLINHRKLFSLNRRTVFFNDIDDDGFSERFVFYSGKIERSYNIKIYRKASLHSVQIIDQYNFRNPIDRREIYFLDITGDKSKEVLVFSKNDTALYLTVIDLKQNRYIYKERFLMAGPNPNPNVTWDVDIPSAVYSDLNDDGIKDLIFTVHSGHSLSPRGIFALDVKNWRILYKLTYNAGPSRLSVCDLNGDGKDEFILTSSATDNIHRDENYPDDKSWLMVFDRQLHYLFEPQVIGKCFTTVHNLPFRYRNKDMILTLVFNDPPTKAYLFDDRGHIVNKMDLPYNSSILIYNRAMKNQLSIFNGSDKDGKILMIDSLFALKEIILSDSHNKKNFFSLKDLNNDGKAELLGYNSNGLYTYSTDGTLLAFHPWLNDRMYYYSYLLVGKNKPPYLSINGKEKEYLLELQANPFYPYVSLAFVAFAIFSFAVLFLFHLFINRIRVYASYLLFSVRASDNAVILLDHNGKIITFNKKVNDILRLKSSIREKEHYGEALNSRPEIAETIRSALQTGKQAKREFSFEEADTSFIGEITVTPFTSFFRFINAVLVEVKDSTRQVLFERQQNWQRNIRRMVHDIKNPLAGVQLKMQTLYLKLVETQKDLPQNIKDEFEEAYSELKRIRNISKDFLKFSDLEMLQPEKIDLHNLCDTCLEHFKLFENESLKIQIHIDDALPKDVFWDRRQIELLIHILVENAIDAVNGKGKIEITVKPSAKVLNTEKPYIEFRISDDGPGIPEHIRSNIFEPHFSTKQEGSGMGLVFAKQIVKQHAGKIDLYSAPDSGTVFVVILPDRLTVIQKQI